MLYKTQGIIIKNSNLGEVDRLITVYTNDFGKLVIKGKSVRKNQAKLKGHLVTFFILSSDDCPWSWIRYYYRC